MKRRWVDRPFAPRRWPFFYGWVIVAASTVGILASIPGQTMGVGVFTDDLLAALDVSRLRLSTAYMFGTITSSFLLPFAGRVLDRRGTRVAVVLSAAGLGGSLVLLSQCERLTSPGGVHSLLFATIMMSFIFLSMRFFGQGCLTMTSRVAVGKWFNHRRGLAAAISGVFVGFGFNASPRLLNWLVQELGWRAAAVVLALAVGGGMSLLGWVFYRDNPEDCGLVMDGVTDAGWHQKMAARVPETRREFTRGEAVRTLAFWAFSLGIAWHGLMITAFTFHVASIGAESGLSRAASYAVFLPMAFFGIGMNFFGGWVSDRIRLKWLLLGLMLVQAAGTMGIARFDDSLGRWMFIAGYGLAGGGLFGTLMTVTWPRFFGRKHLGAISGLTMSIVVFASAIGPVLFSAGRSLTGNYRAVVACCVVAPLLLTLASLKAENPQDGAVASDQV